jgi:CheY-like chemotaxis protein
MADAAPGNVMNHRPIALVIDDSDDTRELYVVILRLAGFVVEEARDGRAALHQAHALLPDIIITDLAMPIVDGWEMIRLLRADERTRRIPVIACSGQARPTPADDCGADTLIPKPCSPDRLLLEVRGLLRREPAA